MPHYQAGIPVSRAMYAGSDGSHNDAVPAHHAPAWHHGPPAPPMYALPSYLPKGPNWNVPFYGPPQAFYWQPPMAAPVHPRAGQWHGALPSHQGFVAGQVPFLQNAVPHSQASLPSIARGPPYKPKRSGHAVWVGNLPPYTTVMHLKDYFSTAATSDIESVFLISKSNCAFVNYRSYEACMSAVRRFDSGVFRGNRLVCRLRRGQGGSEPTSSGTPVSPGLSMGSSDAPSLSSASTPSSTSVSTPETFGTTHPLIVDGNPEARKSTSPEEGVDSLSALLTATTIQHSVSPPKVKEKFFVLKSLTLEDLQVSTRDGSWITQPQNEDILNTAFQSAENVFLLFSVNKSGGYFGYARMSSPIRSAVAIQPAAAKEYKDGSTDGERVCAIETPATTTAPKGRIVDDSARGTIFWEAERDTSNNLSSAEEGQSTGKGGQFDIEWASTRFVPFHATRGLRNPLNSNREVKIARDGTEVHPWVGAQLLQLF